MLNQIIAIYAITDDLLKAISHQEDCRRVISDAEVLTTAMSAAIFFGGNQEQARLYMKEHGLIPKMISKSRLNRRLHGVAQLSYELFHQLGWAFKQVNSSSEYLIDSFPVAVCENIRINNCRLVQSQDYRGFIASKRCYFYGVRVHLLSTASGVPVEMAFLPGGAHDLRGLRLLPLNLPPDSQLYADKAYSDYQIEDELQLNEQIQLQAIRKQNSHRFDPPWTHYYKQTTRHYIETVFSQITLRFPKSLHAVTLKGFLFKVFTFVFAYTLERAFL